MVRTLHVAFLNHRKLVLRGVIHVPKRYDTAIVFLHGFPGHMDGYSKRFAMAFARKGYLCLRFNFSGTDTSDGKFEEKTMSEEVRDIRAAIDFVTTHYPTKRLVLYGHSTGAIDASLYAHTDKRLHGLVLSGAVSDLKHAVRYDFSDEQVHEFWTKGYTYKCPTKPRKKKHMWLWRANRGKLHKKYYDEFFSLDIPAAMKKYKKPVLILHGARDEAIPSQKDPHELYALCNDKKKLVIIPDADHSYKKPAHAAKAVAATLRFIRSLH